MSPGGVYSPKCVEGKFSEVELPLYGVLSSLPIKLCEVHTHRLSQSVLRIGSQSVLFSGLGDCPNKIILSVPSPEKVPTPICRRA